MNVELLTSFEGTNELKKDWDRLVEVSGNSVFSRYAFARNIERSYGDIATPQIYLFHEGSKLAGVAPLAEENGILRFLTGLDYAGVADYCDFIVNPNERDKVYEEVKKLLYGRKFNLREIPEKSQTLEFLAQPEVNIHTENLCGAINLTGTFAEYLEQLGKSHRYSFRRFQNAFDAKLVRVTDRDDLDRIMNQFMDMHQQNWDIRGKSGAFGNGERQERFRNYHNELARDLLSEGNFALTQLKVGDETVAIDYCFEDKNDFYVYLRSMSNDEKFRKYSPGRIMILYLIKQVFELGKTKLDLLRGEEAYKNDFNVTWKQNKTISSI